MIKSVTVTNYLGDSLLMELERPERSGFNIADITGLGPGKAEIRTSEITTNDGSLFNSARLPSRNIVLTLRFMFDPTIEDARQRSYKFFPIKQPVTLRFETDNRLAEITGHTESNDPVIFQKEEYTQISIICPNPYFFSAGPDGNNITVFYGVEPMFEFPFSNESFTDYLLIMGEIRNEQEQLIYYSGDAEIGITIYIDAIGEASNIIIYNVGTRETMSINTDRLASLTGVTSPSGYGLLAGDRIIINTTRGAKSIQLLRGGLCDLPQLSQVIGIYYPHRIDTYVKYVRSEKFYGRYMDDWYIMNPSKEELLDILGNIYDIAEKLGIHINKKKTRIVKIGKTYKYLQIRYTLASSGKIIKRINPERVTAIRRKLKKLAVKVKDGEVLYENVENMFRGWMGSFYKLLSKKQRKNLIELYEDLFDKTVTVVKKKLVIHDRPTQGF